MSLSVNILIMIFFLGSLVESISFDMNATIAKLENPRNKDLDLSSQGLGEQQIMELIPYLRSSQIESLNLGHNKIEDRALKEICKILSDTQIGYLNLEATFIHDDGVTELAKILPNTKITSLDLSTNVISGTGIVYLGKALNKTRINRLRLRFIQRPVVDIFEYLRHSWIRYLDLDDNILTSGDAENLAKGLEGSKIISLSLVSTSLDDKGAVAIAKSLPETRITDLTLNFNKIGFEGIMAILKVLKYTRIGWLDFSSNPIGNYGAEIVAELKDTSVTTLSIGGINLKTDGALRFFDGLNETQITYLEIHENSVEVRNDMIRGIIDTEVTEFRLQMKDYSEELRNNFTEVIERNKLRVDKIYRQFEKFVFKDNDSLRFNVSVINENKIEFIEFYKIIQGKKSSFVKHFESRQDIHTREEMIDFIENIEWQMKKVGGAGIYDDLNNSPLVLCNGTYEEFKKFVGNDNGRLTFNVGYLDENKSKFNELYEIIKKHKKGFVNYCVSEYPSCGMKDFIVNIESQVEKAGIYVRNVANGLMSGFIALCVITLLSMHL